MQCYVSKEYDKGPTYTQIIQLSERICKSLLQEGLSVSPYRQQTLETIKALTATEMRSVLNSLLHLQNQILNITSTGIALKDTKAVLKSAMKHMGLNSDSKATHYIDDEDVVEIYDKQHLQVFRNFRFMELTNYSLLDTFTYTWWKLFARSYEIDKKLMELANSALRAKSVDSMPFEVEEHLLFEIFSDENRYFKINQKIFAPVMDISGSVVGYLTSLKADLIGINYKKEDFLVKTVKKFLEKPRNFI